MTEASRWPCTSWRQQYGPQLPITYFLLNNQRLGLIDRHAVELHGGSPVSGEFPLVDWQRIAPAFGWRSVLVRSADELDARWNEATAPDEPTLVECAIPASEGAPVIDRDHARRTTFMSILTWTRPTPAAGNISPAWRGNTPASTASACSPISCATPLGDRIR